MDKIISKVIIYATEFKEFPVWFAEKFRSYKPEAREKYFRFVLPLVGFKHVGKGLAGLGAMWLTGDIRAAEFLRENDRIIKGGSVLVVSQDFRTVFKSAIRNKIVKYGGRIFDKNFDASVISEGSNELNEQACQYLLPEFAPFTTGGNSHIDFITDKIASPDNADKTSLILGLDIQVSRI